MCGNIMAIFKTHGFKKQNKGGFNGAPCFLLEASHV